MKKLLFICVILLNFRVFAQEESKLKGTFRFTRHEIGKIAFQTDTSQNEYVDVYMNSRITVMGRDTTTDLVYYKYWGYKTKIEKIKVIDTLELTKSNGKGDSVVIKSINSEREQGTFWTNQYNDKIFSMPYKKFMDITAPLYKRYKGCQVGVYTVPFRLRGTGKDFDFESSLSLQSNIVFGLGTLKKPTSWVDLSGGIGLTGISLNSNNSDVLENRTATAITASLGAVFKFNRWANIGLFGGWDWLGAKDRGVNWKYNGDFWIGIGINISFNSIETDKSLTTERSNKGAETKSTEVKKK